MMGLLEDFGYDEEDNDSYSPDEAIIPAPLDAPTDVSALRRPNSQEELRAAIIATANQLGVDPKDIATAISYETAGTFDPWKRGPTTQWGTHRGLIQWGEPQAKRYGVGPDTSITDQLAAVGKYLTDAGVRPGMGLLDIYSAINAGRVGLYNRSDANNGGAPGTVADKVRTQMGGHRLKAAQLLGALGDDALAYAPAETANFPNYTPPVGPRRAGARAGVGYVSNNEGGWTPADDAPPEAMFYGPIRQNTMATPAYIRSGTPGLQAGFVPPEMRGPFRKIPQRVGRLTIGTPTAPLNYGTDYPIDASKDMPGIPLDEAAPIPAQLAALLKDMPVSAPVPDSPILDESAGLNLAKTASNISIPSADPVTQPQAAPEIPSPVLPNLPPKDQSSLLVSKGNVFDPVPGGRPEPPISRDNMPTPSFIEAELPDAPKPAPASYMDMLNAAINPIKQVGAKLVGGLGSAAPMTGAALSAAAGFLTDTGDVTQALVDFSEKNKKAADLAFGVSKEGKTIGEYGGALIGESITPWGKNTAAASVLMGTANLFNKMTQSAQAAPVMEKAVAEKLIFSGIGNNEDQPGPRVTHTVIVPTAAGPAKLDAVNHRLLGAMGIATIGALVVPGAAKAIISRTMPGRIGRQPANPSTGIELFTNAADVLHTSHDRFAAANRVARDLGVDAVSLKSIQDSFEFQTGSASRALTNAAMMDGRMTSPNFNYQVNTSIGKLAQAESPEVTQYMQLWHMRDQVRENQRILMTKNQQNILAAGVPTVRGQNEWQITQAIRAMEAGPQGQVLKDWRTGYLENQNATWRLESTGEYATKSTKSFQESVQRERNNVWQRVDQDNTDFNIGPVSASFAESASTRIRLRMENEAKGSFIDTVVAREPNFARQIEDEIDPVSGEILKTASKIVEENKASWANNIVTFDRRGKTEYWVTDPFIARILMTDPYAMNGMIGRIVNAPRKFVEQTTTGIAAPFFALTTLKRNHDLVRLSDTAGLSTPHIGRTIAAVPQQLYPQMAKFFSQRLDHWSDGWVSSIFPGGQAGMQAMSTKMAQVYDQSVFAALTARGGIHTSMFLDYNEQTSRAISKALASAQGVQGVGRTFLEGYKALMDSIGNAPVYAYGSKNYKRGANPTEIAHAMKSIVGNNNKSGLFLDKGPGGTVSTLPFDTANMGVTHTAATYLAKWGVGGAHELGRNLGPWWNVTTQGMKAVGRAYWNDPVKFVKNAYLYQVMPAAAIYMYNRGLGLDPNGRSYNDYQMNRRSGYNQIMTRYIGIPGLPVEKGITVPLAHEAAVMQALTSTALHHVMHSENAGRVDDFMRTALSLVGKDYAPSNTVPLRSAEEDFKNTMWKWGEIAFVPAFPSPITATAGAFGVAMPSGPFGDTFQKRDVAYDEQQGMSTGFEGFLRGVAPGVGDIVGSGFAAYTHSQDELSGLVSAGKAMTRRTVEKTPFVRDAIGWQQPVSGSTEVTDKLFKDKKVMDNLDKYYTRIDPDNATKETKAGKSKQGTAVADMFIKNAPPKESFSAPIPPPRNQIYQAFIEELHKKLKVDTITERGAPNGAPTGGIGFDSHMKRYFAFTAKIKEMRRVDEGNDGTWIKKMEQTPAIMEYLKQHNVPMKAREVRNFLEMERQTAARQIMFTIKAIEQDFQKRLNMPKFKFEDLDPTVEMQMPMGVPILPFNPQMPSYINPEFLQSTAPVRNRKPK